MEKTKKPRAPRKKNPEVTTSVVAAFGIEEAEPPSIFVEEVEQPAPPVPKAKKPRKPAVVAVVTPDGIEGELSSSNQRPLIAHMPIHSSDIETDMFSQIKKEEQPTDVPNPYDPQDIYVMYGDSQPVEQVKTQAVTRPSLPLHYSEKLMICFQDSNREQRLPDTTDVACYWDCHPFRGQPCVIPVCIEESIWRVYGNFCSPECAAAHLFHERLDIHVQWERYALLNRLYAGYLSKEEGSRGVRLAPSRLSLRLFGGTLDISVFRQTVHEKRLRIDVMTPPMISIIQVMDTKPIDFYDASMKNTFIPWEMDRMNRPGAQGLRLRRTKPLAEKEATLEYCMGIVATLPNPTITG
jgi:hypothetical protein